MTTTAAAIRAAMLDLVAALAPDVHEGLPFKPHRERGDFRTWALQNPATCTRRVSVRFEKSVAPPTVTNVTVAESSDTVEVVVAYATGGRFGGDHNTSLDDTIESDQTQIDATIGPPGYASLTAPATVIPEDPWTVEGSDDDPVKFAVIRYRVDWYRATGAVSSAVRLTGTGGYVYRTGDVITGNTDLRALALSNGIVKVDYRACTPDVNRGAHTMSVNVNGTWTVAVEADHPDWSFFIVTPEVVADRATVIEATDDQVRVSFQWDAYDISTYSGSGMTYRGPDQTLNYAQGQVNPNWKRITSIKLSKEICMRRGEPGWYVGWHSYPYIGLPVAYQSSASGETTDYGERELGDGGGNAVMFASSGNVARWPAWADDVDGKWTTAGLSGTTNRIWWPGIKDPYYAPYNSAAWISTQPTGYPAMQTSGPFWVAGIHYSLPFCRFIVSRIAREIGGWRVGQYGGAVSHFNNEDHNPGTAVPYAHQLFIGAIPYVADSSSAYANEPTAGLQAQVAAIAADLDWPPV